MPFPRAICPQVLSLRSHTQVVDAGVLPASEEQRQFVTIIVTLPNTIHNDMWDGATIAYKQVVNM